MNTIEETLRIYESRLDRRRKVLKKHLFDAENCQKAIWWYENEITRLKALEKVEKKFPKDLVF